MASSGYVAWSVSAGEVPTTAYWNILGSNDASFNTGAGFNDGAIATRAIANNAVTNATQIFSEVATTGTTFTNTWTSIPGWTGGSLTTNGGTVIFFLRFSGYPQTANAGAMKWRIVLNGTGYVPGINGALLFLNQAGVHTTMTGSYVVTGLAASTYSVVIQLYETGGTGQVDGNDYVNLTALEILK